MIFFMIKKLIYIITLFIICANTTLAATKSAHLDYNKNPYGAKTTDIKKVINVANINMLLWEKALTDYDKKSYLDVAMRNYYLATKIDSSSIEAYVGLARVYEEMNIDRLAKEYYYRATNLSPLNADANFYFANFYFKKQNYIKSLAHYQIAYKNGYSNYPEINNKMGIIYEKLADIENAKYYYTNALKLNPSDETLNEKIRLLDELNYGSSQYYLYNKL